ncbi:endo-beta-1,4-xylanase [Lindgomyces ingoldianus]|uniref:Endo-beta-1,4-xylanase n=1 Tax=Lindgomyces ingoldianus TaxID=673940 RepID=A0ACB6RA66_9PLEO|nr:endo-beta-1,4-xylanase [Lindgomyces ingoldianus]KAF2475356.1 endo-beta-1,4-xylanase [Lindgomyces ingoldianus]
MFAVLFLTFSALAGVLGFPGQINQRKESISAGTQATFYNSFWTDGKAKVTYKNGPAGQYSVTWDGNGNFVGGKGWNPGSASKVINYTADFNPNGYSYLTIYGWTTNPLIEFYIVENYHPDHEPAAPPEGEEKGNLTSDGSMYRIRTKMRVNKPSIQGTTTFRQIFSVREDLRESGEVTVANHFKAWKDAGLKTGSMNYMIVATEGNNSSGDATVTVY